MAIRSPHCTSWSQVARITAENSRLSRQSERFDVLADKRARLRALLNEQAIGWAARDRFQAERACAREEIDDTHACEVEALDAVRENVEDAFAHAVRCRPQAVVSWGCQRAAAKRAGDNSHVSSAVFD